MPIFVLTLLFLFLVKKILQRNMETCFEVIKHV